MRDLKLQIVYVPIEKLKIYQGNPRNHPKKQLKKLINIIQQIGILKAILIDRNYVIVCGHAIYLAAKELGYKEVPTTLIDHVPDPIIRAFRLFDNKISELASIDEERLRNEFEALLKIDVDLTLTGYDMAEIDIVLHSDMTLISGTSEEAQLPDQEHIVTQLGDLYLLGNHHVICGDGRSGEVLLIVMDGKRAVMIFIDPPYNVVINDNAVGGGRHREFPMASGEMSAEEFTGFLRDAFAQCFTHSIDGSLHFVCMDWRHIEEIMAAGRAVYDDFLNLCVWTKTNAGMGSLYRSQHELVFLFKKGAIPHINNVQLGQYGRNRTNVWSYAGMNSFRKDRDDALAMHPTVKPVEMVADAIMDVSNPGDIVLDTFLGSGTTLLAAEQTGRICHGVELDPGYVDLIITRWQAATGQEAIHAESDLTFEQLRQKRIAEREAA